MFYLEGILLVVVTQFSPHWIFVWMHIDWNTSECFILYQLKITVPDPPTNLGEILHEQPLGDGGIPRLICLRR